jgi:hypothetical protein
MRSISSTSSLVLNTSSKTTSSYENIVQVFIRLCNFCLLSCTASKTCHALAKSSESTTLKTSLKVLPIVQYRPPPRLEGLSSPLSEIPIRDIPLESQRPFISLVDKILALTNADDYFVDTSKQSSVIEFEERIARMVFELYGFKEVDAAIIEGYWGE